MVFQPAQWVALLTLFAVPSLQTTTQSWTRRSAPVVPSQDPFYQPPSGYASASPGTVLRSREIEASFLGLIPDPVTAYQLLYRTTAINGTAIATVTTVFQPPGAATDRFVSFQTAYDSSATQCDPSYTYQLGSSQNDLITSVEMFILQAYLLSGYIVSSPDYEGPEAAFSPGHLEGMGVLDSMRAVSNFGKTLGLTTSKPMIVADGYSGGAIATGWAASLQPGYAPELAIKGWSHGGTPANLTGTMLFLDGTLFSGFLPAALDGLLKPSAYAQQLQPIFEKYITPFGQSKLDYSDANCATNDIENFSEMSVLSTDFQTMGAQLTYNPTVVSVLQQNIMGLYKNETPTAPVLMYHASQDEIIPYANASTLADTWCSNGASVDFVTFANGGHATTEVLGVPNVIEFAKAAFAGTVAKGCSRQTELNNTLNPVALGAELEPVLVALIEALSIMGTSDSNIIANLTTLEQTMNTNGDKN